MVPFHVGHSITYLLYIRISIIYGMCIIMHSHQPSPVPDSTDSYINNSDNLPPPSRCRRCVSDRCQTALEQRQNPRACAADQTCSLCHSSENLSPPSRCRRCVSDRCQTALEQRRNPACAADQTCSLCHHE